MKVKNLGKLQWLEFDLLAECSHIQHGVFLRHGGESQGAFGTLNVSFTVGDDISTVQNNRDLIVSTLSSDDIVTTHHAAKQCHSDRVVEIFPGADEISPKCDALVTCHLHCALMIQHADCQAGIIYDPIHHVVANVHAGWRGSVANIYAKTLDTMNALYNTQPQDVLVCISPSLGPEAAEFLNYREELPESFWSFQVKSYYFDFWAITEMQLYACGVLPCHIECARLCTYSHPRDFFSYRREKVTGRHGTVVVLR